VTPGLVLQNTQWTVAIEESALIVNGAEVDLGKPAPVSASPAGSGAAAPALHAVRAELGVITRAFIDIPMQLLDSGTTLVVIPSAAAQKLYGAIPGAKFNSTAGTFSVPCATELNVSITLGQQSCVWLPLLRCQRRLTHDLQIPDPSSGRRAERTW
jgi:hypothetical protein